jgi:hypothetical protein
MTEERNLPHATPFELYNDALAEWKAHFDTTGKYLNIYEQDKRYNKTTYPDVPAVVTDQVLKRLHRSLTAFFKGRKEDRNVTTPTTKVAGFSVQPATYWPPSPKAVPPPLTGGVTWGNAR